MSESYEVRVKWGPQKIQLQVSPKDGPVKLMSDISAKTGVPTNRMKVMCNKVWKGVLKESMPDWDAAIDAGKWKNNLAFSLVGTAEQGVLAPEKAVVFVEDMTAKDKQALKSIAPPGLENLGNTCYMNSTLQCVKAIPELRKALDSAATPQIRSNEANFTAELGKLFQEMDATAESVQPNKFVLQMRSMFPHMNTFNARTGYTQEDADEFFNSLVQVLSNVLNQPVEDVEFGKAGNAVDALFGVETSIKLKCTESDETGASTEKLRRLQCVIDGNINTLEAGVLLGLDGQLEKRSEQLGRNAIWQKQQRLNRVPLYLAVQFNRFYWKKTPNSRDHEGVPCKISRPVRFPFDLDIYQFCDKELQGILDPARKKHAQKLIDQGTGKDKMETDEDPELAAAMQLSMNPNGQTAGIGVPPNFRGMYELFGVLTHKGRSSKSGHYMSWVKQKDNKWMCFDDEHGSYCTEEDIKRLGGDGADWHIAYMAFYRVKV